MSHHKRVCLFGTSADPPTGEGGHLGIARHLASMDFDEVRILPVYRHMFGNKRGKQAPFQARVDMCRILFKEVPKVVVSEAERICFEKASEGLEEQQKQSLRIGTADLLEMLANDEPEIDFTLALGSDTFIDLASGKWRRTEDVFKLVGYRMVVFGRIPEDGDNKNGVSEALQESITKWQLVGPTQSSIRAIQIPTLTNVSSSVVRRSTNEISLKGMLASDVLEYIQQRRMYSLGEGDTGGDRLGDERVNG
eukprot:CAMPEP_0172532114 /NCGR_PEP_ID=MMETSP1067-20121228/5283_1 /TAXON_ID=265564 ORGANISM="Thalassiosira punctigera, Strain Tpunct2005C2" /NCGR_SAMPLE_ID=MMETSP1067 /ASSEMBLY_ACC=CAM_ASM_000444 /LENGTH=250 /DNA_ID=CAMNT_0013316585 /DNA_START=57 /DNA_END=809 /DNA_ORIENTATION=+